MKQLSLGFLLTLFFFTLSLGARAESPVNSTIPANAEQGVSSESTAIYLLIKGEVDANQGPVNVQVKGGGQVFKGQALSSVANPAQLTTLKFDFASLGFKLLPGTLYGVEFTNIPLASGGSLSHQFNFTTAGASPANQPLQIILSTPAQGQKDVPVDQDILITFNKTIDVNSVEKVMIAPTNLNPAIAPFYVPVAVNKNSLILSAAVLKQQAAWASDVKYILVVKQAEEEGKDNVLSEEYFLHFETAKQLALSPGDIGTFKTDKNNKYQASTVDFMPKDQSPPVLVSTFPANGQGGVSLSPKIAITFNEPVTHEGKPFKTFSINGGGNGNFGQGLVIGNTLVFQSLNGQAIHLAPNTTYTVTFQGAKDAFGNYHNQAITWSFTTGAGMNLQPFSQPKVLPRVPTNWFMKLMK